MASQASWQTGGASGAGGADWGADFPDQQSVECLLRRLLQQVEETERRYGEALEELQTRLAGLARKADDARSFGPASAIGPLSGPTDRPNDFTRHVEIETSTPLDDFERLGRAVRSGLERGSLGSVAAPLSSSFATASDHKGSSEPFTFVSPFSPEPTKVQGYSVAFSASEPDPVFSSFAPLPDTDRNLSQRLVDMAHRLEQSVDAAMAPKALDELHARMDAIGRQITNTLAAASKPVSLAPLERQIAEVADKLGHAEGELAKIGAIEASLHRLIERIDGHASELSDVAAKAATEAARLVSGEAKLDAATAERLDSMHRDLKAMSARSSAADDRIAGVIECVHESLTQLVRQVERGASPASASKPNPPLVERMRTDKSASTKPEVANGTVGKDGSPTAREPSQEVGGRTPISGDARTEVRTTFGRTKRDFRPSADDDNDKFADLEAPRTSRILVKKSAGTEAEMEGDLVAAARRAAQAAAERAAARIDGEGKSPGRARTWLHAEPSGTRIATHRTEGRRVRARRDEFPLRRGRSLLIACAAVLLALSAILLYSRLQTKPWPERLPPAAEENAPAPAAPATSGGTKAPAAAAPSLAAPPVSRPSAVTPDAASSPAGDIDNSDDADPTEMTKASYWQATVTVEAAQAGDVMTPAESSPLTSAEARNLPQGIDFPGEPSSRSF